MFARSWFNFYDFGGWGYLGVCPRADETITPVTYGQIRHVIFLINQYLINFLIFCLYFTDDVGSVVRGCSFSIPKFVRDFVLFARCAIFRIFCFASLFSTFSDFRDSHFSKL